MHIDNKALNAALSNQISAISLLIGSVNFAKRCGVKLDDSDDNKYSIYVVDDSIGSAGIKPCIMNDINTSSTSYKDSYDQDVDFYNADYPGHFLYACWEQYANKLDARLVYECYEMYQRLYAFNDEWHPVWENAFRITKPNLECLYPEGKINDLTPLLNYLRKHT